MKTVLYIYARFLDLKKGNRHNSHPYQFSQAWLATNTKCTTEAIKYAQCVNLNLIAWHYPEEKNLEYYIEYKKLYPISILPELKKKEKQKLFESNIYTIQDFLKTPPSIIAEILSTDQDTVTSFLPGRPCYCFKPVLRSGCFKRNIFLVISVQYN